MSSNLLEFQAEEKSNRAAFGVQGGFGPKAKGSIGLDVGTSGKYKPIDADIEIPDRDTKNASENVGVGVQVRAGGTGGHHTEGDSDGKGTKHRRDSSSSSSSSSSSDEEGNQDNTSKAKRKKKRKGILSGSFLPKFGTSKKSNKGKGDDAGRMAAPEKVELGLDVSPSSRKLERPQSTEIEIQTDLGMEAACEGNNGESGTQADPDVEIFHGIGADAPKDDYTGVTVTASGVEKFPAPALGTVSGDGTDVDLGLSAKFGEERDDSTSENMDTSDLLSQVENAIKSMEAAAHEQKPDIAMPVISAGDDEPIRRGHGDVHLNSADIAAVNVDSDPTLHVQLAKPKEGPILELPEGDAELSNSHISIEHVAPNVPSQADLETGRHSSTSSSRSSQGEQKQQSKGILPSIKFQLPKFGGKKSKNTDGDANSELDGSISVQSDLVTSPYDGDRRIDSPQSVLDTSLPDVDTNGSSDIHVNTSIDTTFGSKVDPEVGIGSESDVSHLSPQKKEESDDNSDIDAYLGAAAIDVGLPVPVDMDFDASVDTAGTMDMEVPAKPKSKKTKRKLPKLRFGSKKNEKVDLPSADVNLTTETPTFEVDTGGDNERPDAAFEVVGKRASLKKNVELPGEEAPVAPMIESNVESLPAKVEVDGHSLPEININLSHPGTGIDDKEKYLNQDAGFGVNGGLNEERGAALEMDVQYEWPNREAEGDHSDVALQAEGDVDVDGSSDIEAYIGVSSPSDTFPAGVTAVGPTIQGPDSSSKSSFQYSKGKMSKKGTRNLPKVKTKGNRNAFSGKTKKPDDRIDVKVESKGTGSDMKMEIHPHNLDVADPVKPVPRRSSGEVKASSSEPNLVFNDDSKHKRKGFTLPRLKMPKFKKSGRKSSQDKTVGDSFDLEEGGKRSSSLPDISYSTSSDGGGNASSYLDTSNKRKKHWSTGFRFPNFGFPKFSGKQRPQSEADRSGFDEVDVSVSNPDVRAGISIDVDTLPDDVFPGDDGPKEKTPKGDISFNNGVPELGTNEDTTLPEVRVHVDHGGDAKVLDWQQQESDDIDKNITIPSIEHKDDNVVSPEMEVKMNMVEEVSSAPVEVHKSDVGFKSGISGGVQIAPVRARDEEFGDADIAAQVEGDVTFSGVDFTHKGDPNEVSITSSSSESEKHSAKKKRSLFGGIHFPKFKGKSSSKKHIGTGVSFDDGEMEVDLDEKGPKPEFHAEISTPEFDLRPSISTDDSHPKVEAEVDISVENVRSDGDTNVHIPEFELSNRDTDVDVPSGNVEVNVNLSGASDGDINIPRDNVDVDGRGAITLPAIGIKEKYDDNRSVSSTSSSSSVSDKASDKTNKKRGLFGGFHLPKFKGKGSPKKEIGTGVSFDGDNDMEVDIELPRGGVDLNYEGDASVPNVSVDQNAVKPELDVSANEPAVQLPAAAISADHPDGETELNVPGFPGTALGDVDKPSGTIHHKTDVDASIDMNIPKPEVSSSVEVDLPEGDINTQIPWIGVDVSDKDEGQINVPDKDTGLDIDAEGEINLHRFDVNVKGDGDNKSVTSSSSSSSSESEKTKKKKKGFFGGIHLPKFKGKGSRKKEIGTGVSFDGDNDMEVDIELPRGGVDLSYEGDAYVPNVSVDQNAVKPELDVSVNEPAVQLPEAAISADHPDGETELNVPGFPGAALGDVDKPSGTIHPKTDADVSTDMNIPKPEVSSSVEVDLPEGDINTQIPGIGVDVSDKVEGQINVPDKDTGLDIDAEGEINLHRFDVNVKGDGDNKSVTSSSSSSSSESEKTKKKKKGFFGGIHLPKFKGKGSRKKEIGTGVSFDGDNDMEVDIELPRGGVDLNYEGDAYVPNVSVDQNAVKPELDVSVNEPAVQLPEAAISADHPDGETELNVPGFPGAALGDVDKPSGTIHPETDVDVSTDMNIPKPEVSSSGKVDLPEGDINTQIPGIGVDVDVSDKVEGQINVPDKDTGLDIDAEGEINLHRFDVNVKGDGDNKSVTSSSSSSSSESEKTKKKKKGFFGGIHLPKFKGKGSRKKEIGTGVSFDGDNDMEVDIELPRGGVDLNYEGDASVPNVSLDQNAVKPELDISVNEPAVQFPEAAISADHPDGETELNVPGFPGTALGDVDKPSGTIHPKTDVDASIDMNMPKPEVCSSGTVDLPEGDINTHIPGIGVDVDVSDKVTGKINVPDKDTGLDIDAEGEINLHRFDVNVKGDGDNKSVTSSSSSSSSESEKTKKKKKGFFGGIHLPKFKGKGLRKKEIGTGVSFDGDNDMEVDIELPRGGVDLNYEGDASVPNVSLDQNAVKPELDVSVNEPAVELPEAEISADRPAIDAGVNLSVDVPTASVEVDIPTDSLDTTILGGKRETGTGITASKPDVDLPNVNLDASGDVEIPSITSARDDVLDVDREGSVRLPATTVDIDVSGDIRIPRFRKEGNLEDDRKSISSTSSSSSSESEKNDQKKKGLFSGFHLPKFMGKGPKVKGPKASGDIKGEFPGARVDVDAGGDLAVATDVHTPHVSVDEKVSGPKFDVGMSSDAKKPDLSAGISVPVARAEDLPAVKVKLDADLPTPDVKSVVSIDNRHPEIDRKDEFSPSMQKDLVAVGGIGFPKHDSKGSEDDKESISSSSSSSDNEKVKKGGKVGSLAMPAFKGNVSPDNNFTKDLNVNFDGDIDLAGPEMPSLVEGHGLDAEVASSGDVDLNVNIPKPSGESPEVNVNLDIKDKDRTVHVGNPDIAGDFKLSGPTPELDVVGGADVSVPGNEASVDGTIPNREIDALSPSLDLKGADSIDINPPDGEAKVTLVRSDPHLDITEDGKPNVNLPAGDISTEADFQVSDVSFGEIPKKETKNVRFPDVDLVVKDSDSSSDTSSSSDSDGDDKKKKKGFFGSLHFPKFKGKGPKQKTGVKGGRKGDVTLDLDKHGDGLSDDHNLRGGVEIPDVDGTVSNEVDVSVKEKKYDPTADITSDAKSGNKDPLVIDIGEPDVDISLSIPKTSVDSDINVDLVPDVDPTIGGARDQGEVDVEGSVKLPEIETGDAHHPGPEIDVNLPLVKPDAHMELDVDVGKDDSDVPNMKDAHIDSVDIDVKVKGGINAHVDPSLPEGGLELPGLKTEKEIDDETSSSSSSSESDDSVKGPEDDHRKKKGFLPSFHLPKIHFKRPKSPDKKKGRSAASVEVELKVDVDVPDTDIGGAVTTGPDLWDSSVGVSDPDGAMKLQVDEPEVAVSTAKPEKPEIDLDRLGQQLDTSFNVSADFPTDANADVAPSVDSNIEVPAPGANNDSTVADTPTEEEHEITFEKFGKLLAESEQFDASDSDNSEADSKERDADVVAEIDLQADIKVNASQPERKLDLDVDWTQLGLDMSDEEGEPSAHVNAGQSLTRSSSKSSLSSSTSEEEKKPKKTKGFLPSLKLSKFTGGKSQEPTAKVKGDGIGEISGGVEGKVSPSVNVDVELSPHSGSPREVKSPKGRLGLFKRGRGKKGDSPQSPQQEVAIPEVSVSLESTPQGPAASSPPPKSDVSPPNTLDLSGAVATHSMPTTPVATAPSTPQSHFSVVVAIDFGTTFSGYAYSFTHDPENIHVMRKCEGGDPGVVNMKILTTLLMTPEGEFHSFGFTARDFYHDMKFAEAQRWLYFDKYKLALNDHKNLNIDTELTASNGTKVKALTVFEQTLRYFRDRFLEELMDLSMDGTTIDEEDIRWVLTVPAIWRQPAKQFMRQAAYKAGIASPARPAQLMIALEPEAASIYIGKLTMRQLMPERMALRRERWLRGSMGKGNDPDLSVIEDMNQGSRYVVVDCGGGTVDITVHEVEKETGTLKELHKASGGMFGSGNVDDAFIKLMVDIFGSEFIEEFKIMRPAGWVDLLIAFEARKRNANPWKANFLNVSLPFSFIDYYKKFTNGNLTVEQTLSDYNDPEVKWSGHSPGMLRFSPEGMSRLFTPTTSQLLSMLDKVLAIPELEGISHLFLAGGFAESPLLQNKIRDRYKDTLKVVIPQDVGLATMKGAVMFGQNPGAVSMRRARLTYGVGALNKFDPKIHPEEKKIVKDGIEWCRDVFDIFVHADQSVSAGEKVTRSYAPASSEQEAIKINIYCSENDDARFITDDQVRKCGTLTINLGGKHKNTKRRELQLSMQFGDTEMRVDALDVSTGKKVEAKVDFLNN